MSTTDVATQRSSDDSDGSVLDIFGIFEVQNENLLRSDSATDKMRNLNKIASQVEADTKEELWNRDYIGFDTLRNTADNNNPDFKINFLCAECLAREYQERQRLAREDEQRKARAAKRAAQYRKQKQLQAKPKCRIAKSCVRSRRAKPKFKSKPKRCFTPKRRKAC